MVPTLRLTRFQCNFYALKVKITGIKGNFGGKTNKTRTSSRHPDKAQKAQNIKYAHSGFKQILITLRDQKI